MNGHHEAMTNEKFDFIDGYGAVVEGGKVENEENVVTRVGE